MTITDYCLQGKNLPEVATPGPLDMHTPPETRAYLQWLVRGLPFRSVIEVGTYAGETAIALAMVARMVVTLENGPDFIQLARDNCAPYDNVTVLQVDALQYFEEAARLGTPWGMVYLDGDKQHYQQYANYAYRFLPFGGLLVADDAFFDNDDALRDTPLTEKGQGVKSFCRDMMQSDRWDSVILPIGRGLLVGRKCHATGHGE